MSAIKEVSGTVFRTNRRDENEGRKEIKVPIFQKQVIKTTFVPAGRTRPLICLRDLSNSWIGVLGLKPEDEPRGLSRPWRHTDLSTHCPLGPRGGRKQSILLTLKQRLRTVGKFWRQSRQLDRERRRKKGDAKRAGLRFYKQGGGWFIRKERKEARGYKGEGNRIHIFFFANFVILIFMSRGYDNVAHEGIWRTGHERQSTNFTNA